MPAAGPCTNAGEIALAALFLCSEQSSAMTANPSTSMVASRSMEIPQSAASGKFSQEYGNNPSYS